jgi:predicted nucleotidyltransferase
MKTLGIIAEYNPFHNGHFYHLNQAKKITNCDFAVCILSSNFVQRGEPSLVNKWARTRCALKAGFDVVIELPVLYSMSSAEYFAFGGVKILDSLNCINFLCFGSESGDILGLKNISNTLTSETPQFKTLLKNSLSKGLSYPKARENAVLKSVSEQIDNTTLKLSNNILAIEYLKALTKMQSNIEPVTLMRISNNYNSKELNGAVSSATSIRNNIENPKISNTMPHFSYDILREEFESGRGPIFPHTYEQIIVANIRRSSSDTISKTAYVSEGLEMRIKRCSNICTSYNELVSSISTKRYPQTRIQRVLFSSLLGITSQDLNSITQAGGPPYARVLGFGTKGRKLLREMISKSNIPVITSLNKIKKSCNPIIKRIIEIENIATDLYVLGYKNTGFKKAGQEYTSNIIFEKF